MIFCHGQHDATKSLPLILFASGHRAHDGIAFLWHEINAHGADCRVPGKEKDRMVVWGAVVPKIRVVLITKQYLATNSVVRFPLFFRFYLDQRVLLLCHFRQGSCKQPNS